MSNETKSAEASSVIEANTYAPGTRFEAFSVKSGVRGAQVWIRVGSAWVNRDGSLNLYLDVLPLGGKLHIRRALKTPGSEVKDSNDAESSN